MKFHHNSLPLAVLASAAAIGGGTALGGCGGESNQDNATRTVIITKTTPGKDPFYSASSTLLEKGDKITEIPIYEASEGATGSQEFTGKHDDNDEDIVAIHSKGFSDTLVRVRGDDPKRYSGYVVLSEYPDGIYESLALVNKSTKVIEAVIGDVPISEEKAPLYAEGTTGTKSSFDIVAAPFKLKNSWGVKLSVSSPSKDAEGLDDLLKPKGNGLSGPAPSDGTSIS